MGNILNTFYYSIYLMDRKLHFLSNKVNPTLLLFKIPCIKKKYEKKNQNIYDEFNKVFTDKVSGFSIWVAEIVLVVTLLFFKIATFTIIVKTLDLLKTIDIWYYLVFGIMSFYICNLYVFKGGKYLTYFSKYEDWTRREKKKYILLSLMFILGVIVLNFFSLFYFFS